MPTQSIEVRDDAHWHELRAQHIGASEVSCLLGLSKFKTKWRLYHEKRGTLLPDSLDDNKAVLTGRHMEPALATWAAEKFEWPLRKVRRYLSDPSIKAGASLDYETMQGHEPVEVKFSTGFGETDDANTWDWEGDDIIQAPHAYIVQVQYQLMMANKPQGWLVGYVGHAPRRMLVPRSEAIITTLRATVAEFWADVAAAKEPPVDWFADADGVAKLCAASGGEQVTLSTDDAGQWVRKLAVASRMKKRAEEIGAEAKGNLWVLAGSAASAMVGSVKVDLGSTGATLGKLVTEDMVGTYVGARAGFRRCQVRAQGPRKGAKA